MTDRNRFHLHILPGMPVTKEGRMPPREVRFIEQLKTMRPPPRPGEIVLVRGGFGNPDK